MERMIPLSEVEQRLSLSRWTLWSWIRDNKLAATKRPNGHYVVPESEIARILSERVTA